MNKSKTTLLLQDHYNIIISDDTLTDYFKKKAIMLCAILYNRQYNFKTYNGYPVKMMAKHLKVVDGVAISILNYLIDKQIIRRGRGYNVGVFGSQAHAKDIELITNSLLFSPNTMSYKYEYKRYNKNMDKQTITNNMLEDTLTSILDEITIDFNKFDTLALTKDAEYIKYIKSALQDKAHNISISDKTKRMYSIATQMSGTLFGAVKIDDENLMSIDFSNMHPAIFANMLKNKINTEDFKLFYKHATEGTFYSFLAKELNLDIDFVKKELWMKGIYGEESVKMKTLGDEVVSYRENKHSDMIATIFPSFIKWCDEYKAEHKSDNGAIANYIQSKESKLMLDNIVSVLYSKGFKVIPRHDEVLVKQSDYITIVKIIKGILNELDLKINIKNEIKVKQELVFKVVKLEDELAYFNAKEQEIVLFGGGFEEAFREEKQKIKQQDEDDKFYNTYKKKKQEPLMVLEY